MTDKKIDELNELIHSYIEKNCPHAYANVESSGRIHFDGRFEVKEINDILVILNSIQVQKS